MSTTFYELLVVFQFIENEIEIWFPGYCIGSVRVREEDRIKFFKMFASKEVAGIRFGNQMDRKIKDSQIISEDGRLYNVINNELYSVRGSFNGI